MSGNRMDDIYRVQRHFYDLTRKPYLLGRDVLIRELNVPAGGRVLEIGCGTARNLLCIARRYPQALCFGVDLSTVMLETALAAIAREKTADRVWVEQADATAWMVRRRPGARTSSFTCQRTHPHVSAHACRSRGT